VGLSKTTKGTFLPERLFRSRTALRFGSALLSHEMMEYIISTAFRQISLIMCERTI
jgi:hypothetical protein